MKAKKFIKKIFSPANYMVIAALFAVADAMAGSLFSGDAPLPLTAQDKIQFENSRQALLDASLPIIRPINKNEATIIYAAAFDGTQNDENNTPLNEQRTVVSDIKNSLAKNNIAVNYYPGPGTREQGILDAITGDSSKHIAEIAYADFLKYLNKNLELVEKSEIRLVVVGFSRGAAIARHFMNLVNQQLNEERSIDPKIKSFALLFDTVATGQYDKLDLQIPTNAYLVINFIAKNERRDFFQAVTDRVSEPESHIANRLSFSTDRLVNITLPGSHSDIGGSYSQGLPFFYKKLAAIALRKLNLTDETSWDFGNVADLVQHDSRGFYDKITLTKNILQAPTSGRKILTISTHPMSYAQVSKFRNWSRDNIYKNMDFNPGIFTKYNDRPSSVFTLNRRGDKLEIKSVPPWLEKESAQITKDKNGYKIIAMLKDEFKKYSDDPLGAKIPISKSTLAAIPENIDSSFEVIFLNDNKETKVFYLINGLEINN